MALTLGSRRPLFLGAALAGVTLLAAACSSILPQDLQVPKFYVKDYTLNITARYVQGQQNPQFEDLRKQGMKDAKNMGLLYTPNYVFVADPVLLLAKTVPVAIPSDQVVNEQTIVNGQPTTEPVLRNPIFFIDRATVTYQVPGYDIPTATYELQIPVKNNQYTLSLPAVAQVGPLMTAFARDPAAAGTVSGSATVTLDMRDLDPLATQRTFKVTRSLPLVYSYNAARPEDLASAAPAAPATVAPTATPVPSPSPTESPSPSPSPTPSATAT
jgi:hypothetical protein